MIISGEKPDGSRSERVVAEIVLYEGRNRQIRRMFESMKIEVARLRRVAIGNLKLGMLPSGKWRELEPREVQSLLNRASMPEVEPNRAAAKGEERRHGVNRPRR